MPSTDDLRTSKYVKQSDVAKPKIVTIAGWDKVNFAKQGEAAKYGYVLKLRGSDKLLKLNPTNGEIIKNMTGKKDFDDWFGTKLELYVEPSVEYSGKIVGGIRVRAPGSQYQPTPPPPPPPVEEEWPQEENRQPGDDDVTF